MNREMFQISVGTNKDGDILIVQPDMQGDSIVVVSTAQVDALISWLKDAKAESDAARGAA